VIKVDWPQASRDGRYIPPEAKSIVASVFPKGDLVTVQATGSVNLPGSSVTIPSVAVGPKDVRLVAYNGLAGAGTAVAWGVCQATVQAGQDNLGHAYLEAYRLIFSTNRDGGNDELYRATPDGRYALRLTNGYEADDDPAPSPDGKKMAYSASGVGFVEIRLYDNATLAITTFADLTGDDRCPTWSPDSKKIAWMNNNGGTYTLEIKNADGSGSSSTLSLGTHIADRPAWSPDGTRIAFVQHDGSDYEIKMVRADLSGSVWSVTDDLLGEYYPVWSCDGSTIYVSATDSSGRYQVASLHGTTGFWPGNTYSPDYLTNEPWNHSLWGISPDGNLLTYWATSWDAANDEIYYLDIGPNSQLGNSHQSVRVTYSSTRDWFPCFRPPTTAGGSVGGE
jgi:Tol biopolymer transport system component